MSPALLRPRGGAASRRAVLLAVLLAAFGCNSSEDVEGARAALPELEELGVLVPEAARALDAEPLAAELLAAADEVNSRILPSLSLLRVLAAFPPAQVTLGVAAPWDAAPALPASEVMPVDVYRWGPWEAEPDHSYTVEVTLDSEGWGSWLLIDAGAVAVAGRRGWTDDDDDRCVAADVGGAAAASAHQSGDIAGAFTAGAGSATLYAERTPGDPGRFALRTIAAGRDLLLRGDLGGFRLDATLPAEKDTFVACWDSQGVPVYRREGGVETGSALLCSLDAPSPLVPEPVTCGVLLLAR